MTAALADPPNALLKTGDGLHMKDVGQQKQQHCSWAATPSASAAPTAPSSTPPAAEYTHPSPENARPAASKVHLAAASTNPAA